MSEQIIELSKPEATKKNILNVLNHEKPNKIPVAVSLFNWPLVYANARYEQIKEDPVKLAQDYCKIFDEMDFDTVFTAGLNQNVYGLQKMGCNKYVVNPADGGVTNDQAAEKFYDIDVYDEIIKNPHKFLKETMWKNTFPVLEKSTEEAYAALKEAALETKNFCITSDTIDQIITEKKQALSLLDGCMGWQESFQAVFMYFRGIKQSLVDLRRMPEKVYEACDVLDEIFLDEYKIKPTENQDPLPFIIIGYHPQCFMNRKNFERLFFRGAMRDLRPYAELGKKIYVLVEGNNMHTMDYWLDFPTNSVALMPDAEDPVELGKLVGDKIALFTGISASLLAVGTKQECVDYVQKCYDELAYRNGFAFCPNAPLSCPRDGIVENVLAAYERANILAEQ